MVTYSLACENCISDHLTEIAKSFRSILKWLAYDKRKYLEEFSCRCPNCMAASFKWADEFQPFTFCRRIEYISKWFWPQKWLMDCNLAQAKKD